MTNDFIIWDKYEEEFVDTENIAILNDGVLIYVNPDVDVCELLLKENDRLDRYSLHGEIGKTDIDGNKIYADCSIVEFRAVGRKAVGYFTYDSETLRMRINILDINYNDMGYLSHVEDIIILDRKVDYFSRKMSDFKIIDTIQENKLGLIIMLCCSIQPYFDFFDTCMPTSQATITTR